MVFSSLCQDKNQEMNDFYKQNSVISVDRRNNRDNVRISKMKYIQSKQSIFEDDLVSDYAK